MKNADGYVFCVRRFQQIKNSVGGSHNTRNNYLDEFSIRL